MTQHEFWLDIGKIYSDRWSGTLRVLPPLVTGTMSSPATHRQVQVHGFVTRSRHEKALLSFTRYTLTVALGGTQYEKEFPDLKGATRLLGEAAIPQISDPGDLLQHLKRVLDHTQEHLQRLQYEVGVLMGRKDPAGLSECAERLWEEARLHVVLREFEEASECAREGTARLRRSDLPPGPSVTESGKALAQALEHFDHPKEACGLLALLGHD
ncbi:hypothetical protein ACWGDT_00125 [Streptomyces avermitilis]